MESHSKYEYSTLCILFILDACMLGITNVLGHCPFHVTSKRISASNYNHVTC